MNNFDCKDIKAMLSGLVDGEVAADIRHDAERHLVDCKDCRALLSEAEALTELVAVDATLIGSPAGGAGGLPAGFEDAVLRRTVYADAYSFAGRRWTSWLGWVAAAACLLLAVSIWFADRQSIRTGPERTLALNPPPGNTTHSPLERSWTSDAPIPAPVLVRNAPSPQQDRAVDRLIDDELSNTQPAILARQSSNSDSAVSRDDAATLYSASNLLEMLEAANMTGFGDAERIRRIAEYDDILDRLALTRTRISPVDRPAVLATESILLRIVNGPLDLSDLQMLRHTAQSLDLSTQMQNLSQDVTIATTL